MPDETKSRLAVTDTEASFGEGRITVSEPPHLLEYTWGDEILRWELTADGAGGCTLMFVNVFDGRPADGIGAAAGWHAALEVLEATLNNRAVDWDPWDRASQLEPDYARDFARMSRRSTETRTSR